MSSNALKVAASCFEEVIKKGFSIFEKTVDKDELQLSPNLLNREFVVKDLAKVWVSDITYIRIKHSFVYLTTVIDLADRMVVGWNLSNNMTDEDTIIAAFKKAIRSMLLKYSILVSTVVRKSNPYS